MHQFVNMNVGVSDSMIYYVGTKKKYWFEIDLHKKWKLEQSN